MVISLPILGITAAIELIKFVQTSRNLKDKTPEEVLEEWATTRIEVKQAIAAWRSTPNG